MTRHARAALAAILAAAASAGGCQSTRTVTVLDHDKTPVAGARVSISGHRTHGSAFTDANGRATVAIWEIPQWITVEKAGRKIVNGELPPGEESMTVILRKEEQK